jgi:hypothetical protein
MLLKPKAASSCCPKAFDARINTNATATKVSFFKVVLREVQRDLDVG